MLSACWMVSGRLFQSLGAASLKEWLNTFVAVDIFIKTRKYTTWIVGFLSKNSGLVPDLTAKSGPQNFG